MRIWQPLYKGIRSININNLSTSERYKHKNKKGCNEYHCNRTIIATATSGVLP